MDRHKRPQRLTILTMIAVAIASWASPCHAYLMLQNTSTGRVAFGNLVTCNDPGGFTHWTNGTISWYHNTAGQGSDKSFVLKTAMNSWIDVPNAGHVLNYAGTTTAGFVTDNQNTVLWAIGNGCFDTCLALTALVLQAGQVIVETDITFNSSYTWNTNGNDYDTEAVAVHEFGHSLGIHHTDVSSAPPPTMSAFYFGTGGRSLELDDQAALQCSQSRYPPCPGVPQTPAALTVANHVCWGQNSMEWQASCGATHYELYGSTSSTFSSQWLEYSGPDRRRSVNVSTTTYYRVRACNASGCSGYQAGSQPARYYSFCF